MAKVIPAQAVRVTDKGNLEYHLASTAANDDWIRMARKLDEGEEEEVEEMNNTEMVRVVPDEEDET